MGEARRRKEEFLMSGSAIPVDLVLFGMIAVFLVLRLRSILGRRQGFEGTPEAPARRPAAPVIDGHAEAPAPPERPLPDPTSETGQALLAMQAMDQVFSPAAFLAGAENAFRLIVTAFAAGDRDKLRPLLTPDTFAAFDGAITARLAAGQTQRTEIRAILDTTVDHASLTGSLASITVRFVSQQITLTLAADHSIVAGADAVTELVDVWTFTRDLKSGQPAWKLAGAQSA
jgi:predicted lipid-binding transport protein (Tim44 family)